MISALMIWPGKRLLLPWPSDSPAASAVVVMVTARVSASLVKSASAQTKQMRLMLEGLLDSMETPLSAPRATGKKALGAEVQVAKAALMTSAAEREPEMLDPAEGFKFHCTAKAVKSQRLMETLPPDAVTSLKYEGAGVTKPKAISAMRQKRI